jgi:hypothetical protein
LGLLAVASVARADGKMVVGERVLFREGPAARAYCNDSGSGSPEECERVLAKVLSGYSYGRGHVTAGLVDGDPVSGTGWLRISWISGDLTGGSFTAATLDGVVGDAATSRLRLTALDAQTLLVCKDIQSGLWVMPLVGLFSRQCVPRAWLGVDAGALTMQWDVAQDRLAAEWLRFGPAFELLGNGFAYSRLLHSIQLAMPFDLRTIHGPEMRHDTLTTIGMGLRLTAFYRTPEVETRLVLHARTSLAGAENIRTDNSADGELLLLYNFFVSDSVVLQTGLALRMSWAQKPLNTLVVWANSEDRFGAFAGIHVGWVHEPPDI